MTTPNQTADDILPGAIERLAMPATGETLYSESFKVWPGAKSVTIFVPNLATDTSCHIQALTPLADVHITKTWVNLSVFNLADGVLLAADGLTESTAITLPTSALGGGRLRFACANTQAAAATTFYLIWSRDG